jgi:hypothetical protein
MFIIIAMIYPPRSENMNIEDIQHFVNNAHTIVNGMGKLCRSPDCFEGFLAYQTEKNHSGQFQIRRYNNGVMELWSTTASNRMEVTLKSKGNNKNMYEEKNLPYIKKLEPFIAQMATELMEQKKQKLMQLQEKLCDIQ